MTAIIKASDLRRGCMFKFRDGQGGYCTDAFIGENETHVEWWGDDVEVGSRTVANSETVSLIAPPDEEWERKFDELQNGPPRHSSALDRFFDEHPPPWDRRRGNGGAR